MILHKWFGQRIVVGLGIIALVASAGMAMSSLALVRARHRVDIQDALIASLTLELEATRRDHAVSAPVLFSRAEDISLTADTISEPALLHALEAREQEVSDLRSRLQELEVEQQNSERRTPTRAERMQAWRERMQQQDPEGYERRRQQGREMMGVVAENTRDRLQFMQSIPTEGLSPDYLENHHALLERLAFFDGVMQQIAENPDNPDNRELLPAIFANMRGVDEMLNMQRDILLDDLARDIGYEGEEAGHFIEAVNLITEMTTLPGPGYWRRMMRGSAMRGE